MTTKAQCLADLIERVVALEAKVAALERNRESQHNQITDRVARINDAIFGPTE